MRGINKLVMEIKPDDEYFEKALLFLKPAASELPQHEISDGADKLLKKIKENNSKKKKHNRLAAFLCFISGAVFMWLSVIIAGFFF